MKFWGYKIGPDQVKYLVKICAILLLILSSTSLLGWVLNIPWLKGSVPGWASMKVNTALGFLFCSLALLLPNKNPLIYNIFFLLVAALGFFTIQEYVLNFDFGIDQLIARDTSTTDEQMPPGRMSPVTALSFLFTGTAFLTIDRQIRSKYYLSAVLMGLVFFLAYFGIFSFLFISQKIFTFSVYSTLAINTAIGFILISIGFFSMRPERGVMKLLLNNTLEGLVVRNMGVPVCVLLPFIMYLLWRGEGLGWYDSSFGMSLMLTFSSVIMIISVNAVASKIERSEQRRTEAEEDVRRLNAGLEKRIARRTEELQKSLKEISDYKYALDASSIVVMTNEIGIITHVNDNFCKVSKYNRDELLGRNHRIINSDFHTPEFIESMWTALECGMIWKGELRNRAKDGTMYWEDATIVPFLDKDERPYQFIGIRSDITGKKEAEEKLMKLYRLYSFLSNINQTIVHTTNKQELLDGACRIAVNIGMFKTAWIGLFEDGKMKRVSIQGYGKLADELKEYSGLDFNKPELSHTPTGVVLHTGNYVLINSIPRDTQFPHFGEIFLKHGIKSVISFPLKRFGKVVGIFSFHSEKEDHFDIDEITLLEEATNDISFALDNFEKEKRRKQAEFKILKDDLRLKRAQRVAHIGHWELDLSTRQVLLSDELCRIFGIETDTSSTSVDSFLAFIHPEDRVFVLHLLKEQEHTLQDIVFDSRIIRNDGNTRYLHNESKFEFDHHGRPIVLYGVAHDVTESKMHELEREKMIGDMIQRNKDLEQFSYIVSHNLRMPVANIIGFTNVLNDGDLPEETEKELREGLTSSVKRLDAVIGDLNHILQAKRNINEKKESISLSKLLEDIKHSVESAIEREKALIVTDFSAVNEISTIKSYMYSIFYNLISNSLKYRNPEVQPVIEIRSEIQNHKILLYFKDNGIGIDLKSDGEKVFGLYKRFHSDRAEGKGIGLFMVKTQVETLNGRISVQSEVNHGTEFKIEFAA
jgi:PAS domain S-box-containing protein